LKFDFVRYNRAMRLMALQSGSNGNSIYVEAGGMRFLVDAGISGVQMRDRLATRDVDPRTIDGLLISHDHSDHTRCMGIYHRKYGIPVYVTNPTLMEARRRTRLGIIDDIRTFRPGDCLQFGSVTIETVPTPHDSIESVGFVFDDGQSRVGVLTDLGHIFSRLRDVLCSLDAVLLESNYDPDLLESGPYPEHLKKRVRGPGGHLSNFDAAELLGQAFDNGLQWACLAHLSEQNNHPELALTTHRQILGHNRRVTVASRYAVSAMHVVDR